MSPVSRLTIELSSNAAKDLADGPPPSTAAAASAPATSPCLPLWLPAVCTAVCTRAGSCHSFARRSRQSPVR